MTTTEPSTALEHTPAHQPGAVLLLRQAIGDLDRQREALAEMGDYETLSAGLAAVRALTSDLRTLAQAIEADVARLLPERRVEIPGVGVVERKTARSRSNWQWAEILNDSLPKLLERNGGSVLDALGELVQMLPLNASTGPRLAVFRDDLGFTPSDYCLEGQARPSVRIIGQVS